MSFRRILWVSAVAMSGLMVLPSFATDTPGPNVAAPPAYNLTFVFPATGFAPGYETVRITVVNIAPASHGTPASCNGSIAFHDSNGGALGSATAITKLGTGQMMFGEYKLIPPVPLPGRAELQGSVQVAINPAAPAPCSLLLTLEVYETATGVTRAIVTAATEEPIASEPVGLGRGH